MFKVPRHITHELRLRDADADIAAFVSLMEPLGDLVGGMTLQLPASFAPVDLSVLESQVRRLPAGVHWSVEVRHPGFFEGGGRLALDRMLARNEVERVLLDSRALFRQPPLTDAGRDAWSRKPRDPGAHRAAHRSTDRALHRLRRSRRSRRPGCVEWQPIVADWLGEGRAPTFFVHTPDNADSPGLARAFHAEVGLLVPGLEELPEPLPIEAAEQGSLF